ncbi:hypothetical protein AB0I28_05615 [Phytomonospora sp. NPDC050363]|uniref:hypothetical protein n=1 Tax=Phytomonospora sp. NPDC050363 TaxID=3155642 RepID=UPI0034111EED
MNARDPQARHTPPLPYPPFTLLNRPPATPPPTARHPQLWTIQLHWWNRHTPHPNERHCHFCRQLWPCASWFHWDDLLRRSIGHRTGRDPGLS